MASAIPLFLTFSLCFPLILGNMGLVEKTCRNTKYYDLCVTTLKSNATSSNTDTKGLALIMIGVGRANATATSSYLSSQLLGSASDMALKKVLKECADKYTYASDAFQASAQDLAVESFDYASVHVMAATDYLNACHNAFRRYPGLSYLPEIARKEEGLKRICDVVMEIIDLLFSP